MDARRIERIARDIISDFGFPAELVEVDPEEGVGWRVTLRASGRLIYLAITSDSTAVQVRERLRERLEAEP